jgi:hypothetical protein
MDVLGQIGRILLSTWLGIFLGAEIFLSGPAALLHPGLIALYISMFLLTDELQAWRQLSQRHIFILGMLFEIWFGGLINQELYQPGLAFPLGLAGINLISLILITSAWGMFLVTWMHLVEWVCPRPAQLRFLWLRRLVIAGALLFLGLYYISNQFQSSRATADLLLVILGTVGALAWFFWTKHSQEKAVPPQFSRGILTMAVIFILLSLVSLFVPLARQFHVYWTFLVWMPLFFYFVRRRRLRL